MSAEHSPEQRTGHEQSSAELETAARERLEQLQHHETAEKDNSHHRAEAAREVIHRQEEQPSHEQPPAAETHKQHPVHRILDPHLNYAHTLASLQRRLKPAQRTFSKVIHTPVVERTSEALEKTIARPSVTAGAGWTAFVVGLVFYLTARHYGYPLSGSEMIASFLVGGLLGLVLEWLWRGLHRRRHRR